MALEQTIKDLQAQNAQLQEMFLNLSKGLEEVKEVLINDMIMGLPEDGRDDWLGPRFEVAILKDQLASQMALIQNLARGQEELRVLVNKLLRDDQVGQTFEVEDQVIIRPPLRQEGKGKAPQLASGSQTQKNQLKKVAPRRQFTRFGMSLAQVLQHLLRAGLVTLRVPHPNPNLSAPTYHPNRRCAYHSYGPGHDTEDC